MPALSTISYTPGKLSACVGHSDISLVVPKVVCPKLHNCFREVVPGGDTEKACAEMYDLTSPWASEGSL